MTMSSRRNPAESIASRARGNIVWGWFFIAVGGVSLLCFLYAAIISKFLPPAKSPILAAIQNDRMELHASDSVMEAFKGFGFELVLQSDSGEAESEM